MFLGSCLIYVASTYGVALSHYLTGPVTLCTMAKMSGAMHVAKITTKRVDKSGQPREYVSHLLRRTYREVRQGQTRDPGEPHPVTAGRDRRGPGLAGR